jgi:hypothetical protein
MTTARNTWKQRERDAAEEFGSQRQPSSGSMGRKDQTKSDSVHPRIFLECKLRQRHSVVTLWDQVADRAHEEGKTPVICLMEKWRQGRWWLVRSKDLRSMIIEWLVAKPSNVVDEIIEEINIIREMRLMK